MSRASIWGSPKASSTAWPAPRRRNPFRPDTPTPQLVQSYRMFARHLAQAQAGTTELRPGVAGELLDLNLMLKDRIAAGDTAIPADVRAAVLAQTTADAGPAPKARVGASPPPDVAAEIEEELGPAEPRKPRVVPGMAAPARPARSAKLAAAEQQRRTAPPAGVRRGMSEEEFYAATGGTAPRVAPEERAKWADRAQRAQARDDLEIVTMAARRAAAAPAPVSRASLRQFAGEEDEPPPAKTAREQRARARLQRTRDLPEEVEEVVAATVVRPSKRIGVRSESSGKTYVRAMDIGNDAPVFTLGGVAMPTMKRGGHGKTRGPLVEAGQITLEPGWIRGVGCGDARYDKAGIAVLVNGNFSGRWATSWEAAEELARRLLAIVAKNNPRRPWAPMSRTKKRAAQQGTPRWINKRGTR